MDGLEEALERRVQLNRKKRTLVVGGEVAPVKLACSPPPDLKSAVPVSQ
ncbi:MAG: hypothetical protein OXI01_23610 [Albidovulum sp.]|nr:hypothetical protein [Albidovulum sp.]